MIEQKLAKAFDEPGCEVNRAKTGQARRQGCSAKSLTPGAAAGGCAFDGAKIALQPITDAAHLVHGPLACESNSWDSRHSLSSGPTLYRTGLTTDLSELDIIHGGEDKLFAAILAIAERWQPPAVFVYVTCVPALIGDDVEAVCRAAADRLGVPVIPVMAPGFAGSKNFGNKLAGDALLDHVIGTREPEVTTAYDINLLGEYNVAGDLWQILPLLDTLGIRVLASITGDARFNAVATAHRARLDVVVCSQAMASLARKLQERYQIPFVEVSFYGLTETSDALRTIARGLVDRGADAALLDRTEVLIAEETIKAETRLASVLPRLAGKRALLYSGGVKSWSGITALQDLGMSVIGTSIRKSTDEDKARARTRLGEEAELFGQIPAKELDKRLRAGEADILISGGRSQFTALKARVPWLDINQERHHAYAGYDGFVELAERLDQEINSPIWRQVRRAAPWDHESSVAVSETPELMQ